MADGDEIAELIADGDYVYGDLLDLIDNVNSLPPTDEKKTECVLALKSELDEFLVEDFTTCEELQFYGVDVVLQRRPINGSFLCRCIDKHQDDDLDDLISMIAKVNSLPNSDTDKQRCIDLLHDVLNQQHTNEPEYCQEQDFYGVQIRNGLLVRLTQFDALEEDIEESHGEDEEGSHDEDEEGPHDEDIDDLHED